MKRGVLAICVAVVLLLGMAATARALGVIIDIQPGSDPNSIKCNNPKEVITVAILTTSDFDATEVDPSTVEFEGALEMHATVHVEDAEGDGDIDLVFHFRLDDTSLNCDSSGGMLTGTTFDGVKISGSDTLHMILTAGDAN